MLLDEIGGFFPAVVVGTIVATSKSFTAGVLFTAAVCLWIL